VETRLADSSDFDLTLLDLALMMASQHFPKPKENYL
jgi:hypothetical protein